MEHNLIGLGLGKQLVNHLSIAVEIQYDYDFIAEQKEYLERALEMAKHQDQDQDQDYMYQDQEQDQDTATMGSGHHNNHILVKRGMRPPSPPVFPKHWKSLENARSA